MAMFVIELTKTLVSEFQLIYHGKLSMKDALACGDRTVMMYQGEIVLDVWVSKEPTYRLQTCSICFSR